MKLFKLNPRFCSLVFLFTCLIVCGIIAWKIGEANAVDNVWVAREKIVDADPYVMIQKQNIARGLLFGAPVFVVGGLFSIALSQLYYAALCHFRGEERE